MTYVEGPQVRPARLPKARSSKVLLLELHERTALSGKGYMVGHLGKAKVIAFKADKPDRLGQVVWAVYVAEPDPEPKPT